MVEPEDFVALVEREYLPLCRVATLIVRDPGLGEEVVQEAFTRALLRWGRISRYDRPGAWLRLVTVRLAVRSAEKRRPIRSAAHIPDQSQIDTHPDPDLAAAIAELSPVERAVIVLHYLCDLPVEEVATAMRSKPATTRVRLHRARAKLADALTQEGEDVTAR